MATAQKTQSYPRGVTPATRAAEHAMARGTPGPAALPTANAAVR